MTQNKEKEQKPKKPKPRTFPLTDLIDREKDKTVVLCGYGGSLHDFDWSILKPWVVIGLNDVPFKFMPDYHVFVDSHLANKRYCKLTYVPRTKIVCQPQAAQSLHNKNQETWGKCYIFTHKRHMTDLNDSLLYCDRTVACAGLELAWKLGASTVYMIGVDGAGRRKHPYYADKEPSRSGKNYDTKTAMRKFVQRGKKMGINPIGVEERIEQYDLVIEPRHLDWWANMATLHKHWVDKAIGPRVVNMSPISIFTMWETVRTWEDALTILRTPHST